MDTSRFSGVAVFAWSGSRPKQVSASASVLRSISVSVAAGAAAHMQASHQRWDGAELARQHRGTLQTYLV